ncbi:MAG: hypothetical protein KF778_00245 [Rhodocyclaceae bacterium]|nr:hypothetical protein [Rhodocyclaceae bacterium]MBX3666810.1 hypothetical protein [Rhodocyclaceae bacterium]
MDSFNPTPNAGTKQVIDGQLRVFYEGYWVKAYETPNDTLQAKKYLIEALARRLFNHVEHGINIPGKRLGEARGAFEAEADPERRRIKGAMLAGALFNRAIDIFTKLVELQGLGVQVEPDNSLMRECGLCLREALDLGRLVLHRSGEEGIDELWGEPFKAFSVPLESFYESRYLKIAQTMRDIDRIGSNMIATFGDHPFFEGFAVSIHIFAEAAKVKCETLRTDPNIFDVWTEFVVAGDLLVSVKPNLPPHPSDREHREGEQAMQLLRQGRDLLVYITRARTCMPKSTAEYIERCKQFQRDSSFNSPLLPPPPIKAH